MWGARERAIVGRLEPVAETMGLTIIEIELPHQAGGILRIFVDRRDGKPVMIGDCAAFSPVASGFLDTQEGLGFRYHLEVSSPGLERPVRRWEELPRFVGKRMQVAFSGKVEGRKKVTGLLASVDAAGDSFEILIDDGSSAGGSGSQAGATVRVPRGMVKRIHLIWEGDK